VTSAGSAGCRRFHGARWAGSGGLEDLVGGDALRGCRWLRGAAEAGRTIQWRREGGGAELSVVSRSLVFSSHFCAPLLPAVTFDLSGLHLEATQLHRRIILKNTVDGGGRTNQRAALRLTLHPVTPPQCVAVLYFVCVRVCVCVNTVQRNYFKSLLDAVSYSSVRL